VFAVDRSGSSRPSAGAAAFSDAKQAQIEAGVVKAGIRVAQYALRLRSQFFQQMSVNDAALSTGLARANSPTGFER